MINGDTGTPWPREMLPPRRMLFVTAWGALLLGCGAPSAPWPASQSSWRPREPEAAEVVEAVQGATIERPDASLPPELKALPGIWAGMVGSQPGFSVAIAVESVTPEAVRVVYAARSGTPGGHRSLFVTRLVMTRVVGAEFSGTTTLLRVSIRPRVDGHLDVMAGDASFSQRFMGVLSRRGRAASSSALDLDGSHA